MIYFLFQPFKIRLSVQEPEGASCGFGEAAASRASSPFTHLWRRQPCPEKPDGQAKGGREPKLHFSFGAFLELREVFKQRPGCECVPGPRGPHVIQEGGPQSGGAAARSFAGQLRRGARAGPGVQGSGGLP